ncbi:hypothetical protein Ancab_021280 [Ancistrocladus abbreviatus]
METTIIVENMVETQKATTLEEVVPDAKTVQDNQSIQASKQTTTMDLFTSAILSKRISKWKPGDRKGLCPKALQSYKIVGQRMMNVYINIRARITRHISDKGGGSAAATSQYINPGLNPTPEIGHWTGHEAAGRSNDIPRLAGIEQRWCSISSTPLALKESFAQKHEVSVEAFGFYGNPKWLLLSHSQEMRQFQALVEIPSADEVKANLWPMGDYKAPSIDGFPVIIYKTSWDIIAPSLIELIRDFFQWKFQANSHFERLTLSYKAQYGMLRIHFGSTFHFKRRMVALAAYPLCPAMEESIL